MLCISLFYIDNMLPIITVIMYCGNNFSTAEKYNAKTLVRNADNSFYSVIHHSRQDYGR